MKSDINLEKLLGCIDVPAQLVGLREVYESNTPRMIRDGVPVSNHFSSTHGIMVEVLVDGQFGYYGTPDMSSESISKAAEKAYYLAKQASKSSTFHFDESARPAHKGSYDSPYVKSREELLFNGKTLAKNSISTLDKVLHLLNISDKNIFKENNYISAKVLNLIEQIKWFIKKELP